LPLMYWENLKSMTGVQSVLAKKKETFDAKIMQSCLAAAIDIQQLQLKAANSAD
ncbi:hypothetical protein PIB30_108150, partial [Stylosanthes scabra]|nr:hypothetical protein [Stylosanthes scabra]